MLSDESHPAAPHLLQGIKLGSAGDYEGAVRCLELARTTGTAMPDVHFNLGVAYRQVQRVSDALTAFEMAVSLRPQWPEAHFNLANAQRDLKKPDQAIASLRKSLELRPGYLKALNNLGNLLFDQGQFREAEKCFRQALSLRNDYADGLFNLGRVLRRLKRPAEALAVTSQAAALRPTNARFQLKLAELQKLCGDGVRSQETLARLHRNAPESPETVLPLARSLLDAKKDDEALLLLDRLIGTDQVDVDALWLRADIRRKKGDLQAALEDVDWALRLNPESPIVHNLRGVILSAQGKPDEAVACYEEAARLKPHFAEAHNNLGAALQAIQVFGKSNQAIATTLRLKPDFVMARLNHALTLLREGKFSEGWREFEWRFLCPDFRMPSSNRPVWCGEPLQGRVILIRCEQGLGDTIQFIRYAKFVKASGGRVIVECQGAVQRLVANCEGVDEVVVRGAPLPHYDVQVPMMSIPGIVGTTLESIPTPPKYLAAEPDLVERWRERLRGLGELVVGIAWQGNKKFQADHLRSLGLHHFKALAEIPGVALVSLQKNEGLEQLQDSLEFKVHHFTDELDLSGPFRDTAAIISAADLVVTSDTAVAHLAGALGNPVWMATSFAADWRWMEHRDTSPWYPNMRLFRQPALRDWASVFRNIAAELLKVVAGDRSVLLPMSRGPVLPTLHAPLAAGELIDKITILEIKALRLSDIAKLSNVRQELSLLQALRQTQLPSNHIVADLTSKLRAVNEQLWDIEDRLRECERLEDFGAQFVELARSVYLHNDHRAVLKRQLSELLGSSLVEEKSYVGAR